MDVTTYYLQMLAPGSLHGKSCPHERFELHECEIPCPPLNRFLYQYVGAPWRWTDKLEWSDEDWLGYVHAQTLRTWVAYDHGTPAGYFELQHQPDGEVEIAYFGLAEAFIGKGYGGYLLTRAVEEAWSWGARRVWVHTCSLDHPGALANYRARGFEVYRTQID